MTETKPTAEVSERGVVIDNSPRGQLISLLGAMNLDVAKPWVDEAITEALQAHTTALKGRMVEEIIKMADELEHECGKDGDKGMNQWRAFKGFRNSIREKFITNIT